MYEDDKFEFIPKKMFRVKSEKRQTENDLSKKSKKSSSISLKQLKTDMNDNNNNLISQHRSNTLIDRVVSATKTEKDVSNTPALSYDREIMNQTMGVYNSNRHGDRLDMEN